MYKSVGFQSGVTPMMEGILDLHSHIFFFLILVFVFVFWMFGSIVYTFWYRINYASSDADFVRRIDCVTLERLTHATLLEVVWTIVPSVILVFIAVPSFGLLYAMDEVTDPVLTVKVVGHQWYWSYQFSTPSFLRPFYEGVFQFDSYMIDEKDLKKGNYRLLEVDNPLVLPFDVPIRLVVTSDDVIHSFALPQLGLKIDAVPGRLNQQQVYIKRGGVFYGQCSELCGVNHGFMPIVVRSVNLEVFKEYLLKDPNYSYLIEAEAKAKAKAEAEAAKRKEPEFIEYLGKTIRFEEDTAMKRVMDEKRAKHEIRAKDPNYVAPPTPIQSIKAGVKWMTDGIRVAFGDDFKKASADDFKKVSTSPGNSPTFPRKSSSAPTSPGNSPPSSPTFPRKSSSAPTSPTFSRKKSSTDDLD